MRARFILFSFLLTTCCTAQIITDTMLIGAWRQTGFVARGKYTPAAPGDTNNVMAFYADHRYQRFGASFTSRQVFGQWQTVFEKYSAVMGCTWSIDGNKVNLGDCHMLPVSSDAKSFRRNFDIISIAGDSMVVRNVNDAEMVDEIHYHRRAPIPFETETNYQSKGDYQFYLVSVNDSTKRHALGEAPYSSLELNQPDTMAAEEYSHSIDGYIDSVDDKHVYMRLTQERIDFQRHSMHAEQNFDYSYYDEDRLPTRTIMWSDVKQLSYTPKHSEAFDIIGGAFLMPGMLGALFVSPLVSYNFKNGTFNSKRYLTWMKYSLLSVGVSIPFAIIGSSGKERVVRRGTDDEKGDWWLRMKRE